MSVSGRTGVLFSALVRRRDGGSAVEFALVAPVFVLTVVGAFFVCQMALTTVSLHFAVEDAARCASVRTTVCKDATTTQTYASSRYFGPNVSPTFIYASAACGNQVTGTVSFTLDLGTSKQVLPITASACAP